MQQGNPFIFDRANLAFASGQSNRLGSWNNFWLFALGIPLLAGFLLYTIVFESWLEQAAIDRDYGVTQAEITDGYSVNRMVFFISYTLRYAYEVDGTAYTASQWVGDLWNQVGIGDTVSLRYATRDPAQSYIEGETIFSPGRLTWTVITLILCILLLIVAVISVYVALTQRRLFKEGKRIAGTLISVREIKLAKGGIVTYDTVFEFTTPSGERIEGKKSVADSVTGDYRNPPTPGTPVLILYRDEKHYLLL